MPATKSNNNAYQPAYRRFTGILVLLVTTHTINAQSKLGFENYNYIRQQDNAGFVPMFHLQTKNNWYTELRYNYEDAQTVSLFTGKSFEGGNTLEYSLIPMIGLSTGRFTGASVGLNTDASWKSFNLCSQSQYSIAMKKNTPDFFFNWSELTFSISKNAFAGLSMQYTLQEKEQTIEPGIVAGINFKSISFPVYVFNPFRTDHYFVVGLNYEYNLGKK
jgi:hypothetical protein